MANSVNENIVTGKSYRILKNAATALWDKVSFWTKASDVEIDNKDSQGQITGTQSLQDFADNIQDMVQPMTGATSSTAGEAGLVPAPAAGDDEKCLKGDGTWGSVVSLPTGGTAAQMLEKQSSTDGDAAWADVATQMTYDEYVALTPEEKNDGRLRIITDRGHTDVSEPMTWAQYSALTPAEQNDGTFRLITDRNLGPMLAEGQAAIDTEGIVTTAGGYSNTQALLDELADRSVAHSGQITTINSKLSGLFTPELIFDSAPSEANTFEVLNLGSGVSISDYAFILIELIQYRNNRGTIFEPVAQFKTQTSSSNRVVLTFPAGSTNYTTEVYYASETTVGVSQNVVSSGWSTRIYGVGKLSV